MTGVKSFGGPAGEAQVSQPSQPSTLPVSEPKPLRGGDHVREVKRSSPASLGGSFGGALT